MGRNMKSLRPFFGYDTLRPKYQDGRGLVVGGSTIGTMRAATNNGVVVVSSLIPLLCGRPLVFGCDGYLTDSIGVKLSVHN